jgi:predicted nucleic acid-binding protein
LFDTNILIDDLRGVRQARAELASYPVRAISAVTFIEVMAGAADETAARALLDSFTMIPVSEKIAERAVWLGRKRRLDLPDAIIWASAQVHGLVLITRNTRDFPAGDPAIRTPYVL